MSVRWTDFSYLYLWWNWPCCLECVYTLLHYVRLMCALPANCRCESWHLLFVHASIWHNNDKWRHHRHWGTFSSIVKQAFLQKLTQNLAQWLWWKLGSSNMIMEYWLLEWDTDHVPLACFESIVSMAAVILCSFPPSVLPLQRSNGRGVPFRKIISSMCKMTFCLVLQTLALEN